LFFGLLGHRKTILFKEFVKKKYKKWGLVAVKPVLLVALLLLLAV